MMEKTDDIKIRLRKGDWEVEITCSENQVKQVVENVLSGFITTAPELAISGRESISKGTTTCRALLEDLWNDEWFSTDRGLGEVHEELARRGYHYDRTAVSHALTDLVRESILTRTGSMRSYRYVQKRPP